MPLLCAIAIVRPEMKVIRGDSSVLLPGSSLQSARASKNYNLILFRTILHPPDSFVSKNEGMAEGLGSFLIRRLQERLPHIHHRQTNPFAASLSQKCEEHIHALLRAIFAPEPDRAPSLKVAHDDTIDVALADGDLINANDAGPGLTSALDLFAHVLHLECLDGSPIEKVFLRHILDRRRSTASADVESKALGVERVVGQPIKLLLLHPLAAPAVDPTDFELKVDAHVS